MRNMVSDFRKFWCCDDGVILLDQLSTFWLVVVRARMSLGVTMQRAEIVSTSTSYWIPHYISSITDILCSLPTTTDNTLYYSTVVSTDHELRVMPAYALWLCHLTFKFTVMSTPFDKSMSQPESNTAIFLKLRQCGISSNVNIKPYKKIKYVHIITQTKSYQFQSYKLTSSFYPHKGQLCASRW